MDRAYQDRLRARNRGYPKNAVFIPKCEEWYRKYSAPRGGPKSIFAKKWCKHNTHVHHTPLKTHFRVARNVEVMYRRSQNAPRAPQAPASLQPVAKNRFHPPIPFPVVGGQKEEGNRGAGARDGLEWVQDGL